MEQLTSQRDAAVAAEARASAEGASAQAAASAAQSRVEELQSVVRSTESALGDVKAACSSWELAYREATGKLTDMQCSLEESQTSAHAATERHRSTQEALEVARAGAESAS